MTLIVLPLVPLWSSACWWCPPDGSCFQSVGPQGFVKYLSKYAVILGIDDIAFDGREVILLRKMDSIGSIFYFSWRIFLLMSGGFLLMRRIFYFSWMINFTDVEDILLLSGGFLFLMKYKLYFIFSLIIFHVLPVFIMEDILFLSGIFYKMK